MAIERCVISIRRTGLGDRLVSLGAAWLYARRTGRTLVVDWRFSGSTAEGTENAFLQCFENRDRLGDVPLVIASGFDTRDSPKPRYPASWSEDATLGLPFLRDRRHFQADQDEAVTLIRSGTDRPEPTIVFDGCVNDGLVRLDDARAFYSSLRPKPAAMNDVERFRRERLPEGPVIGLHVRHGNGGDIMGHARHWRDFDVAIRRCVAAVSRCRELLGKTVPVLLCTDSARVKESLERRLSGVIARDKPFRPIGTGELHTGGDAWRRSDDALIEMLLLSDVDALVRYPPSSFFSLYGAAMLTEPASDATIYDLQQPWLARDRLGPAIVRRRGGPVREQGRWWRNWWVM